MIRKLSAAGVILPQLYVVDSPEDVEICKNAGLSYIIWKDSNELLIKLVFLPTLKKKFPHIQWNKILGIDEVDNEHMGLVYSAKLNDISSGPNGEETKIPLDKYVGGKLEVDIDQLEVLGLMPSWLGDLTDNIRKNYENYHWTDGWNKKLSCTVGRYEESAQAPNLLIVDISYSIPFGIAATLLTMVDTMRSRCNADLIITGGKSMYWEAGEELPSPRWIRENIPQRNEVVQFSEILRNHVAGKQWGNVIVFGDQDSPEYHLQRLQRHNNKIDWSGTNVEKLWSFHTQSFDTPGYACWIREFVNKDVLEEKNSSWCNMIN